ncbi:hypothetical protein C0991_002299 [Blastosporella zonata]|nr:hypothetical protein C0991_002299 [Blastosporella zonata]
MVEKWMEMIASGEEDSAVVEIPSWASRLETFGTPSKPAIFVQSFLGYIPMCIREVISDYMPAKKLKHARYTASLSVEVAEELYAQKSQGHGHGKDIMSLLGAIPITPPSETLRYHPVVINTFRQATRDDILPLSKPIMTTTGEVITELPIPKGLHLITSITGYNRLV